MNRLIVARPLAAGVLLAGILGAGAPAGATHGGATAAICRVSGGVKIYNNNQSNHVQVRINEIPAKHWYEFRDDTNLTCTGEILGTSVVNSPFAVTAKGWTTGITNPNGEICEEGKSDGPGNLEATGARTLYGKIEFRRVASAVYAWGSVYSDSARQNLVATLDAVMGYTPTPATDAVGCGADQQGQFTGGVKEADLDGIGVVTDHTAPGSRPIP